MRAALIGGLAATALLAGSGAWLARGDRPVPLDTQTAVDFFLSACKGAADDLTGVATRAKQQHWTSLLDPSVPENDPLKVTGMWGGNQNGQSYMVTTGVGHDTASACQVMFESPKPRRDDFFAAISKAMTLRAEIDRASGWRTEIYQIENLTPGYVSLLFVSDSDGSVYNASIMGPSR